MTVQQIPVSIKFLDPEAKQFGLPIYRYGGDAGSDLHVIVPQEHREAGETIYPGERKILFTGVALSMPVGYWARITHRSSTEKRLRLRVIEGTIDSGYQGPIYVGIANENTYPIVIPHGSRIAQIIFCPVIQAQFAEVDEFKPTDRGANGFGSTGHAGQPAMMVAK